jgi:hypothetical protein
VSSKIKFAEAEVTLYDDGAVGFFAEDATITGDSFARVEAAEFRQVVDAWLEANPPPPVEEWPEVRRALTALRLEVAGAIVDHVERIVFDALRSRR